MTVKQKWPTASLRTEACNRRKRAREAGLPIPTDQEIMNQFVLEGKVRDKNDVPKPAVPNQEHIKKKSDDLSSGGTKSRCKSSNHNFTPDSNDEELQKFTKLMSQVQLPPAMLTFLQVTKVAQAVIPNWRPTDTLDYLRNPPKIDEKQEIIEYHRPKNVWSPKQEEIMNAMQVTHCGLEGDKQTGKTTCTYAGIIEDCIMNETHWHFFAQNGNNASRLYIKARDDKPTQYLKPYYAAESATRCTVKNILGTISMFEIHNTTVNDVSGCTGNVWIDEVDKVLKDNPRVIATAVALLRSNPKLRLIFTMNKGSGTYKLLLEKLQKWAEGSTTIQLQFLLLEKKDAPWAQNQDAGELNERDEFIGDIMQVCMGEEFVKQQLENADTGSGDAFNYTSLEDAFALYETYLRHLNGKYPALRYMTIDPSGTGHPFGVFIGGYNPLTNEHIEIESCEIQMGDVDPVTHELWSPQKINTWLLAKVREYGIKKVAIESNSGGQQIAIFLRANGIECIMQNFGAPNSPFSRSNFLKLANHFLDERKVVLKNQKLKSELTIYNPAKDKDKFKGDVADAFLHYIWLSVGGIGYLRKQAREQAMNGKQDEMFGVI
jgi:hypothetical protein